MEIVIKTTMDADNDRQSRFFRLGCYWKQAHVSSLKCYVSLYLGKPICITQVVLRT